MKEEKDAELWQQAKARADFKIHLATYIIINGMIWIIWFISMAHLANSWLGCWCNF